ncbi:EpsG family protein [Candidatus Woesearchaeota archaeon]|nr:EpsG family protein [Candidatus Woesearchaeota archaeon]
MKLLHKILIVFIVSTIFFIIQHSLFLGWDFSVYVSNAKYLFGNGSYFEIYRPPLTSIILGLFHFLGWKISEYIYIVLVSLLFMYASVKLAKSLKLNPFHFYLLSANVFVLLNGLIEGSELLAFALLELFIAYLIDDKPFSTLFLSLACLTRYPIVIFFPLILFHKGLKNKIISALLFVVPFIPWFIYNKSHYGNIFYSIADSFALNIIYRDYIQNTLNISSILSVANILLPLFIIGVFYFIYNKDFSRKNLIFLFSFILILYSIFSMKADVTRYYLPLTLPFVFFSVYALSKIPRNISKRIIILFIIITPILLFFSYNNFEEYTPQKELYSLNCSILSNVWAPLNYYGIFASPSPDVRVLDYYIRVGYLIHLDYSASEPDYAFNSTLIAQYPIYSETESYIILGDGCIQENYSSQSYLNLLNEKSRIINNSSVSDDPCVILFKGFSVCYFINNIFTIP